MPSYHAELSPSGADRWTDCTASPGAQRGIPNKNSLASMDGTCGHQILAECLEWGHEPQAYLGAVLVFWYHDNSDSHGEDWYEQFAEMANTEDIVDLGRVTVTQELVDAVYSVMDFVQELHLLRGGMLEVEQAVPIGHITGELRDGTIIDTDDADDYPDHVLASGTSDVTIVGDDWIIVVDAKFGRKPVFARTIIQQACHGIVDGDYQEEIARANLQMAFYALGAARKYAQFGDFKTVTVIIAQPFAGANMSEYTCSMDELRALEVWLRAKAVETRENPQYRPSPENCFYCRAAGNCKAQTDMVLELALEGFDDETTVRPLERSRRSLGTLYQLLPLVARWIEMVEVQVKTKLLAGARVTRDDGVGYKLIAGKMTPRRWMNEAQAEMVMQLLGVPDERMYKVEMISPSEAEKLARRPRVAKGETKIPPIITKEDWEELQEQITTPVPGAPVIVLETDPRPPVESPTDGFEDVPLDDDSIV